MLGWPVRDQFDQQYVFLPCLQDISAAILEAKALSVLSCVAACVHSLIYVVLASLILSMNTVIVSIGSN